MSGGGADLQRWQPPLTLRLQVTACWNSALTLAQLEDMQFCWLQADAWTNRFMVRCSWAALSACCSCVSLTWVSFTGCRFACTGAEGQTLAASSRRTAGELGTDVFRDSFVIKLSANLEAECTSPKSLGTPSPAAI